MRKPLFTVLILFYICSCSTKPYNDNQSENIDSNKITIQIIDTIKNHHLGAIRIGDSITKVITKLKEKFIVTYDSIPENYEDTLYDYYYIITDNYKINLFKLYPGQDYENKDIVHMFEIYSNRYITDKGIKVGDKVLDLKSKYTIKDADFNYDDGLWLFVEEFKGAFGLDVNESGIEDFNFENPKHDSIPEQMKINRIIIH